MNWQKDLLVRRSVWDSIVLAGAMYWCGVFAAVAVLLPDAFAYLVALFLLAVSCRKGWLLWHALHRLGR